ncbi:MAG: hypothetical protein ACRDO8_01905, partial [Nocardioidaceae bacterium]
SATPWEGQRASRTRVVFCLPGEQAAPDDHRGLIQMSRVIDSRSRRRAHAGPTTHRLSRVAAATVALVVLAGCGAGGGGDGSSGGPDEHENPTRKQATAAALWLGGQLGRGVMKGEYGTDWGLTVDTLFALEAADPDSDADEESLDAAADRIVGALEKSPDSYFSAKDFEPKGGEKTRASGAVAKTLVAAEVADADPHSFGSFDLVEETTKLIVDDGAERGRLKDHDPIHHADYSNLFGQAYAVMGLAEAGQESQPAVDFLLEQQCSEGYFRLEYNDAKSNPELTCDGGKAHKKSAPTVDGTALALSALLVAKDEGTKGLDKPIDDAVTWLTDTQADDGSFVDTAPGGTPNSNSTGLAAQALAAAGETEAADAASKWIATLQVDTDDAAGTKLADQAGAVARTEKAFTGAETAGIDKPAVLDEWRRATAPATLGLAQDGPL